MCTAHLHRINQHRQAQTKCDVFGDVECHRGLAHARAPRENDEVAILHAGSHFIEIDKAGRFSGHRGWVLGQFIQARHHVGQQARHRHEALAVLSAHLGDIKYFFLGFVEQLARLAAIRHIGRVGNFFAHAREAAGDRAFAHDFGVEPDIGRTRRAFGKTLQVADAANTLKFAAQLQGLRYRQHIRRLVVFDQLGDVPINAPVVIAVKIFITDDVADAVPRLVV